MEAINKDSILKELPLFVQLSAREISVVRERSGFLEFKKEQIIYQEGSPADAFYCLVTGRAVIYTSDAQGNKTVLEYLHRGKYFGIISLLTGDPHSVTAQAINDCILLVIKKEDFDFILKKIPRLAIDLSQTLSRRLKNRDLHQKTIFESTVISVFSSYSPSGKTTYVLNLALSLKKETRKSVIVLDICPQERKPALPQKLGMGEGFRIADLSSYFTIKEIISKNEFGIDLICLNYLGQEGSFVKRLVEVLSLLVNDYHFIILDLPALVDESIFSVLNQSDSIHILTSPEAADLDRTRNLVERLRSEFRFQEEKIKVIINEYKVTELASEQQRGLLKYPVFATLPQIAYGCQDRLVLDKPDCEYALAVKRIARQVGDCLVGLALGVGVAYGFCHIGVLKAIEEEKIPIDVISGSSMGALLACLWAVGYSSHQILDIVQKEFKETKNIWGFVDFTFPASGFIKGKKLYTLLDKYLGNKTFYDLKLPLKIIASDIKRKEPRVLEHGFLIDAVMTSCCMPGVFRPFRFKEELLLDGGIINPLPTEILLKMGIKKIIAVNVTPSKEDIMNQYEKIQGQLADTYAEIRKKQWFSLRRYFKERFRTNILDIIFSSIEVMQSEIEQKEAQLADIVLHPDTSGLNWLELHRAAEFVKRGEDETRRHLDKIWRLIKE